MCYINILKVHILKALNIIIYLGISLPVHGREVVECINATDKIFVFRFLVTVQIPGSQMFDTKWQCTHQQIIMM